MNVRILIPALNEEETIGDVIEGFKRQGFERITVIDGNSTDRTRDIAKEKGAEVIVQSGKGKGQAVREAFEILDDDVIVMIDADSTYMPEDVQKLLEPIEKGVADHVVGNRLLNFEEGAFRRLNLLGNRIINLIFRILYGVNLQDILSGYRAMTKEVYKNVNLEKMGFEVETELTVETIANGFRIMEVPIYYRKRRGKTKLKPFSDGYRIVYTIYNLLGRYSPGRYFYLIGLVFLLLGFAGGIYVVYDWFRNVSHFLLVNLVSMLVVSGILIIAVGFLSDSMMRVNIQIKREMREIRRRLEELESKGD
ncbi:S-layer glycoprotein N-glycosyltransferase AglJ [Geoglobus acetivorans]|uniref:S-layer glycoprotein N-glycosyltransferase AglJ n=1 Tax=Geoglobus acetivorans TaxID=565033 RepID=A0ABZ3H4Z9_GEOAI|nr:S-layer glycoprotein N-glycosyltransferase AglJ [Geoglobus acetivorans]